MAGTGIYGELLKAQLENLSSDPGSTSVGRLYWNTTTQSARIYTSSGWDDFGGGGSGASGRNYLSDWFDCDRDVGSVTNSIKATGNITISTSLWQASDTAAKLTVARTSSSPLRQTYSLLLDNIGAGAAFVQTPCFLLDAADLGKPVTVSFDVANVVTSDDYQVYAVRYTSGGTYQEQIPIAGTASATSPYSARIPTGTTKFQGFFIAGSTSTDYYVIRFYRNSASDTTDIKVDSLYVGPEKVVQGAAVTDWVAFTPTWTTLGTTSSNAGFWRRVGDSMQVQVYVAASASGSGSNLTLTIPGSYSINTSKVADISGQGSELGNASWYNSDVTDWLAMSVRFKTATTVGFAYHSATYDTLDGDDIATGDIISAMFTVPISGWSSNVTMADRAVERYFYTSEAFAATGSTTVEGFAGQATTNNAGTAYTKTITHGMPGAKPFLELSTDGGITWFDASSALPYNLGASGTTNKYGARIDSATATTVTCTFGGYAIAANDDSPTYDWGTGFNWRVRMVIPGAAVGFPISPANITKAIARYTTNAAQSIENAGSGEVVNFEDKVFDTRNSVTTGASWKFTAPEAGYYRVSSTVLLSNGGGWAAGEYARLSIRKNGTVQSWRENIQTATHSTYITVSIDDVVQLNAGEYLDVLVRQTSGGAIALWNQAHYNFVSIEQIA